MSDKRKQSNDAAISPTQEHSCEICGASGLTDDYMREHTRTCHVEGNAMCPFCGLSGVAPAELLLHVNQAHLDYLTPENELMSFIDDQSPSVDGDSDSISECRGFSPTITDMSISTISTSSTAAAAVTKLNGTTTLSLNRNGMPQQQQQQRSVGTFSSTATTTNVATTSAAAAATTNGYHNGIRSMASSSSGSGTHSKAMTESGFSSFSGSSSSMTKSTNGNSKYCDMNGSGSSSKDGGSGGGTANGLDKPNGSQGSPLRSQLGLNLKTNKPASNKQSPLQCPMCPYSSDSSNILEEHINRSHFDPVSPSVNSLAVSSNSHHGDTLHAMACPICVRAFESASDLELHVNIEHRDILSPARVDRNEAALAVATIGVSRSICPVCSISLDNMKTIDMEMHIEGHFAKSPKAAKAEPDLEKQAQKLREQREFEMLRAQYGMDDQGNFREQSAAGMQRAVYAGEMSVADYYERQVGLRAAESHGIDDGTSCTKSVAPRVLSLSSASSSILRSVVCTAVDHYASNYGDKGWGCGYRNLQMILSSLLHNTTYNEALYSAWGTQGPSRTAMPSISRLQKMVEAAWAQGFDVQGSEQLGCKLYNTRKWIGATEVITVLSWLRINCQLIDFHRPTSPDGHVELFNWVLRYFDEAKVHTPPLYLQHQGHSRTIIGIEQRVTGLSLLILDPSHGPRQVAALGSSQDSLRLIRRSLAAMRAPQYQIVAVRGLIDTEEQYQASKVLRSIRIPADC